MYRKSVDGVKKYLPPLNSQSAGPLMVKCHSNMLSASGAAVNDSLGVVMNSRYSRITRLTAL